MYTDMDVSNYYHTPTITPFIQSIHSHSHINIAIMSKQDQADFLLNLTLYGVVDNTGKVQGALFQDRDEAEKHCIPAYHLKAFKHIIPKS